MNHFFCSALKQRTGSVGASNGGSRYSGRGASLPAGVAFAAGLCPETSPMNVQRNDPKMMTGPEILIVIFVLHFSTENGTSTIEPSSVNRGPRWSYATTRSTCGPAATSTISHHSWLFSRNGGIWCCLLYTSDAAD